jgi:hypothetical protein
MADHAGRGRLLFGGSGRAAGMLAGPFMLATWTTAKIGPDIHARVDKVLYSVA